MFGKLFRRDADNGEPPQPKTTRTLRQGGIAYTVDQISVDEWLAAPFDHPSVAELGALLGQISAEGYGATDENSFLLGWEDLYRLRRAGRLCRCFAAARPPAPFRASPDTEQQGQPAGP
jgi:hypothetical protein